MDPNWFYSSLAQSAAAVVGLLGGIVATRLEQQIERATDQRTVTIKPLHELNERIRSWQTSFVEFRDHAPAQLERMQAAVAASSTAASRLEQVPVWHSAFARTQGANVTFSAGHLAAEKVHVRLVTELIPVLNDLLTVNTPEAIREFAPAAQQVIDSDRENLAEIITHNVREAIKLAHESSRQIEFLRARTNPGASLVLWFCLVVLSSTGLIGPLAFLSAYEGLSRTGFLVAFSSGIVVLLGYILYQIRRLHHLNAFESVLPPS